MSMILKHELHHLIRGMSYQVAGLSFTCVYMREGLNSRRSQTFLHLAEENFCESMISEEVEFLHTVDLTQLVSENFQVLGNLLVNDANDSRFSRTGKTELYRWISPESNDAACTCKSSNIIKFIVKLFSEIAVSFPKLSFYTCAVFRANFHYRNDNFKFASDICTQALISFDLVSALEFYHYTVPVVITEE